ncbi:MULTISPECIES: DNA gyrase inhibitor YacG [Candidatus Ichthyocystis]|uniref:DNA gyrase inhibitor YacG n=1 Tax=Candidatus Ichthyocystis TaxID=2929841 RepID=UPI000B812F24|nr:MULTISPECIES: DNA gyrase inhibitor YacG [Ichthyocystis]
MSGVWVSCPICRKNILYSSDNPWRPFCSELCRKKDWVHWMNEEYVMDTNEPADSGSKDDDNN